MKRYTYWMANLPGLTAHRLLLLRQNKITAERLFHMGEEELRGLVGLDRRFTDNILIAQKNKDIEGDWMRFCEKGINFVSIEEEDYPKRLKNITGPPYALYYLGSLPKEEARAVSVVGSRVRSAYGSQVAEKLTTALGENKIEVISGLALGIDADAHRGALAGGGRSYAVLACGVDHCYPRTNRYLYDQMLTQGGIISEYPPGTPPRQIYFPQRNRIIAGLSDTVVVIEARKKSGSLITADYAMEQGRDVYALPGRITDELSFGTNNLIAQGAAALTGVEEFLRDLSIDIDSSYVQMDFRKNFLEKDEMLVYTLLDFYPTGLGTMVEKSSFSLTDLLDILDRLESKGFARETVPNYYVRTV
jgi:DNA processing protein